MEKAYYKFYSDLGKNYHEEDSVYRTLRGRIRRKFVCSQLDNWQGMLLDIGCNRGMYMAHYKGGPSVGVDISLHLLKYALDREKHGPFSVSCILGDAEELGFFTPASFERVLCSEVLEHVYNPGKVIAGSARVLKPGGIILVTVPNYSGKKPEWEKIGILKRFNITGARGNEYYHTAFKPSELAGMLEKEGLLVLEKGTFEQEVKYASKIPALLAYFVKAVNRLIFRSQKIDYWNGIVLDILSRVIYYLARLFRVDPALRLIFREGVRTFAIAKKP